MWWNRCRDRAAFFCAHVFAAKKRKNAATANLPPAKRKLRCDLFLVSLLAQNVWVLPLHVVAHMGMVVPRAPEHGNVEPTFCTFCVGPF